jgi:hypothetical protein
LSLLKVPKMPLIDTKIVWYWFVSESFITSYESMLGDQSNHSSRHCHSALTLPKVSSTGTKDQKSYNQLFFNKQWLNFFSICNVRTSSDYFQHWMSGYYVILIFCYPLKFWHTQKGSTIHFLVTNLIKLSEFVTWWIFRGNEVQDNTTDHYMLSLGTCLLFSYFPKATNVSGYEL